jgi:DNA invertase Pin-like site-specific DNA recombinase
VSNAESLLTALTGAPESAPSAAPATKIRAIAWARVSTDMQEERGLSMPEQLREIRCYAEKHGIEIVEEFEEAASAFQKDARRTEFHRMIAQAKRDPDVSAILVHDFSRFSRDSTRAKALVRELREAGIRVISLNDPDFDPDSVAGVYMEAITFAKNEAYSREVAFHTRKGCRANIQARDAETGWCYKNGGQPLWGYRSERLQRGQEKNGYPIIKSIWVLDDMMVAGRPMHDWTRHCLVDMAGAGVGLDVLRDFCNQKGIPGRRKAYWGSSTLYALLEPSALLQYCGYGVWNVRRKNGSVRPTSEWVIVPKAHPAIITEEEARHIAEVRRQNGRKRAFDAGFGKSRDSQYLLSGGLFKCARCGSNMMGFRSSSGCYYVCGSQPYRRGLGCGPGVYVPKEKVEREVIEGLLGMMDACCDPKGLTRQVNDKLRQLWEEHSGSDPNAARKVMEIEGKIGNIRRAVEDGLSDAKWANGRLQELEQERARLAQAATVVTHPPQIDPATAISYKKSIKDELVRGSAQKQKRMLRDCIYEIQLAPELRQVETTYRIPEPVVNQLVAGAGFEPATSGL